MFKATAQDGLARCGQLVISKNSPITTPTPMLYTRRGASISLTPDMLEKLRPEAQLLQITALQL
jgi:queuine/archaeosine tRNA-ribosyltransferase